jgi:outer membrane lipoprotein-sorting protein
MTQSRRLRWAVPAVVAVTVAGAVLATSAAADPTPAGLAPRTATELLADLAAPTTEALSGTVTETANLGLPELPGSAASSLGPLTLLSGTHTLRVWADGPTRSRVALQGQLAEYDVVRSGRDVWTWSNEKSEAAHLVLPERTTAPPLPVDVLGTPAQAAAAALAAVDPSTGVSVEDAVTVAGRAARQLVLTPKGSGSLVGSVRIAVDASTNVPLRVQVFAAADTTTPALEVGFSAISYSTPDAAVFTFTPPAGASVTELAAPAATTPGDPGRTAQRPTVTGTGWTSVVELSGVDLTALTQGRPQLLDQLTTRVAQGRVLSTALVSVLLSDDGRVLVGAVPPATLEAAA